MSILKSFTIAISIAAATSIPSMAQDNLTEQERLDILQNQAAQTHSTFQKCYTSAVKNADGCLSDMSQSNGDLLEVINRTCNLTLDSKSSLLPECMTQTANNYMNSQLIKNIKNNAIKEKLNFQQELTNDVFEGCEEHFGQDLETDRLCLENMEASQQRFANLVNDHCKNTFQEISSLTTSCVIKQQQVERYDVIINEIKQDFPTLSQ